MKTKKLNLVGRVILACAALVGGASADPTAPIGRLDATNFVNDVSYENGEVKLFLKVGTSEGYVVEEDRLYDPAFIGGPVKRAKIISAVPGYELSLNKSRPDFNFMDLEFSLHSESGEPMVVSGLENKVIFEIDPTNRGWDFGDKPITYWEIDSNDPNISYLRANIRRECLQNGGTVSLDNLNETYFSEEVYLRAQIRFDTHYAHLNPDDNIVNFKDYTVLAGAYGRTGITDANRADPNDKGAQADLNLDDRVDTNDLSIFSDYWLTSKKYHLEDGWIIE